MINRKLQENTLKAIHNYPQPIMFGGVRFLSDHPLPGGNGHKDPSSLYTTSHPDFAMLNSVHGGKINFNKIGKTLSKLAKDTGNKVLKSVPDIASKALSKYGEKALTDYLAPAIESAAMEAGPAMAGMGVSRGRGRPRRKTIEDIVNDINARKDIQGGSFKSVMKKVGKVGKQVFNKALPMAEKYAMNTAKTALMDYALPAAETGAEFVAANPEVLLLAAGRKYGGGPFGKKGIDKLHDKIFGGTRKGRFVKGSIEAKEHMAKVRAMRK